jgi:hypothetical protein
LDGVTGAKGIRDPIVTVVVSTVLHLCFISYGLTLLSTGAHGLCWWRLSSDILSYVVGGILLLGANNIGDVVGSVAGSIGNVSCWIGR